MFFELVGCIHRYHASLFRAVYVGDPPDAVVKATEVGIETLQLAKDFVKPGVRCGDVHALVQDNISNKLGIDKSPVRAGYSIGIAFAPDWGEGQIISFYMDDPRPPGSRYDFSPHTRGQAAGARCIHHQRHRLDHRRWLRNPDKLPATVIREVTAVSLCSRRVVSGP